MPVATAVSPEKGAAIRPQKPTASGNASGTISNTMPRKYASMEDRLIANSAISLEHWYEGEP